MKLGALNTAIKQAKDVKIRFHLANLHPVTVIVQKGSILEAIKETFTEGKAQETGLTLNSDGFITREAEQ